MPRLWSALIPESYVQQPATANATQQQQPVESVAATSAARQVLAAGQAYNEAMRHLETALASNMDVPKKQLAGSQGVQNVPPAAQLEQDTQVLDQHTSAQAMDIKAPCVVMQPTQQADGHLAMASDPAELFIAKAQEPAQMQVEPLQAQQLNIRNQRQEAADTVDDGYISLLPTSGPPTSKQLQADTEKVFNTLADAESSDSQGSLPDIDSGESDSDEAASE